MITAPHPLAPELRPVSTRDLLWLVGSLVLVIGPHAQRAPWWLLVLTAGLFAWRYFCAHSRLPLPSRWLVIGIAIAAMAGVWYEYRTLFGRQPGIVLLALFAGLKLLETRTHRDAAVGAFLGYFLIITNFLYTQTIPTALLMFVALFTITTTLIGFSAPQRAPSANARTAALVLAHAAPAALVLFLLFPRVQGPLWGLPQDAYTGMTGLSETMSPGNLSSLAQSDSIAFRAEFQSDLPPPALRYWRGPVLWDFDGRTWRIGSGYLVDFEPPGGGRATYRYDVVLEPHNRHWLFALETAASVPDRARMRFDGQLISLNPVRSRMRYSATSVISPDTAPEEAPVLRRAQRLPTTFNPRARALAEGWRAGGASDDAVLIRAIEHLKAGGYTYTLEPPILGQHSVDEFLFETKAGFCEHFASAFTFLMRAAGIPSRVVTGYQGGELNPIDRVFTVRQSEAHAWSEVYLAGRGWVRVDPTGAAVPGRIESGLARSMPSSESLPLMMQPRLEWLRGMRYQWEALAHKWNTFVLGYNPEHQRDLMSVIGMRDADWRQLTAALFSVLGLLTLALLAWSLRRLARPDPVQKAWGAFCRKLAARGVPRAPHEGPRDYALRAARELPGAAWQILRITALYIGLRYGSRGRGADQLRRRVRELRLA